LLLAPFLLAAFVLGLLLGKVALGATRLASFASTRS
jgi:hypothetical protein